MNFLYCSTLKMLKVVYDTKTGYTRARHRSLSRSVLILYSHLCLSLPSDLFLFRLSNQNFVSGSHVPHSWYVPRQSISPNVIILIIVYLIKITNYEALQYACFGLLSFNPLSVDYKYFPKHPVFKYI